MPGCHLFTSVLLCTLPICSFCLSLLANENISQIAFGTLNPFYDDTPSEVPNILDCLPKGTLIDTAERYGTNDGDAELMLGAALQQLSYNNDNPMFQVCSKALEDNIRFCS